MTTFVMMHVFLLIYLLLMTDGSPYIYYDSNRTAHLN